VVERKYVAGSCPNIACLPSKNIIHSAKVASFFYRSTEFGISKENVRINMAAVRERKRKMVANIVDIFRDHYLKRSYRIQLGRIVSSCSEHRYNFGEGQGIRGHRHSRSSSL
jgi:pyruvate/2-oxoglutarate dehydrogenase complex dihydrolipoamide dehydrogenase (E3) component